MTQLLARGLESLQRYGKDGVIYIHNLRRPMRERAKARATVGPYMWKPTAPGKGRGFYQAQSGLSCDPNGSTFDLRLVLANDHITGRLNRTKGYYCNEDGDCMLTPIVARLPHGRGYLAGWTMGAGMCASVSGHVYRAIEDAARDAHDMAEGDADMMRESDEAYESDTEVDA